jgi:hypothetical protein
MSFIKFGMLSSSESSFSSSKSFSAILALLVPSSPTSLPPKTLDDDAYTYYLIATILENIRSNLNINNGSILACLNFFAPLISYI